MRTYGNLTIHMRPYGNLTIHMRTLDAPLSELFPKLFSVPRPMTLSDAPVIVAASMLLGFDSPILPITKLGFQVETDKQGFRLFRAIAGLSIIRLLVETEPRDYYEALWKPCDTTSIWIGSLVYEDTLETLLRVFELTGFGDVRVDARDSASALITLNDVASLYKGQRLNCLLGIKEVASPVFSVDPEIPLLDAMTTMYKKRVRRLFLNGREGEFVSDRCILELLFSPKALRVAEDAPAAWIDMKLAAVKPMKARFVSPQSTVEEVATTIEPGHDVFMLSQGGLVVSGWDLVMKPWMAGGLYLSPRAKLQEPAR
jgi:CBS domain-containing protein